jgi:hypothetical protein
MRSRSRTRYRGALSHGNASRSCCAVHSAVGCAVTAMHNALTLVREPQKQIQHLNRIVGTANKSTDTKLVWWFIEECPPRLGWWVPAGEEGICLRSSRLHRSRVLAVAVNVTGRPHPRFSRPIRRIRSRNSRASRGLPTPERLHLFIRASSTCRCSDAYD